MSCHSTVSTKKEKAAAGAKRLRIALAGNANVGKSVIFNQLTGQHQTIGNWPGKTVERAEGVLEVGGRAVSIIDLPGIYSLSTYSLEEVVTREYIAGEKPDVVIDVIGAPVLERNLFFTLQLMEMDVPLVVCLNQMDIAEAKGITIDAARLEAALGVPVVPTVALRGKGIKELMETAVQVAEGKREARGKVRFPNGVEADVEELSRQLEAQQLGLEYPSRWLAIKLLEGDSSIKEMVRSKSAETAQAADAFARRLEESHGQPSYAVMASQRYALANSIAAEVEKQNPSKQTVADRLERLATHKVFGYLIAFATIVGLLMWTFTIGDALSGLLSDTFSFLHPVDPAVSGPLLQVLWNGVFGGFVAGVTLVIPFVIPFYLMLAIMEDSGILTRVAFMMDSAMHHMGLHGKAIIPLILGYGCNVPAIHTTRIMGSRRERLLAAFAITFAPCAARTVVILGLVAVFIGTQWALALYAVDLLIMFILLKLAVKAVSGELSGLIMEMHSFKVPDLSVVARQTWSRTRSLIYMVFPMYIVGTAVVQGMYVLGALEPVNGFLSPLTVGLLGLPAIAGILLIFGIVRKELILLTLAAIYGANLAGALTPVQLMVLALIGMLYLPCIATIGILAKEFGWKAATAISAANLVTALVAGVILSRVLGYIL